MTEPIERNEFGFPIMPYGSHWLDVGSSLIPDNFFKTDETAEPYDVSDYVHTALQCLRNQYSPDELRQIFHSEHVVFPERKK